MAETLSQLAARLVGDAELLRGDLEEQAWETAHRRVKECARSAGQLLHRLTAMLDVLAEARATAEVDRALKRVQ